MPVTGFRVGERVVTPSGWFAIVVRVNTVGSSTATVRYEHTGKTRKFRQASLRSTRGR